ncbi:hypothetical protein [Hungatella hominis]
MNFQTHSDARQRKTAYLLKAVFRTEWRTPLPSTVKPMAAYLLR